MANYIIFDKLPSLLSVKPFLAGKTLLNELYIANHNIQNAKESIDANYFDLKPEVFVKNYTKILIDASNNDETIIALDDNSYLCLANTKNLLESSKDDIDELSHKKLCEIAHINSVITQKEHIKQIKKELKYPFSNFSAGFYVGNDIEKSLFDNEKIDNLFDVIGLKRVKMSFDFYQNGYDIYEYNDKVAKKIAAKVLYDAFDNGADFLIVNDIRTFTFFDTCQKKIAEVFGRDINMPILTLPQVVLISMGVCDKNTLGFNKHSIKPNFI